MNQYISQAKLGRIHDKLRRKIINRQNQLVSLPVECLRIKIRKSDEGDTITHTVKSSEMIHAVFPPMENIPIRYIEKSDGTLRMSLSSLVSAYADDEQKSLFTVKTAERLNVEDLVCRVFFPENSTDDRVDLIILKVSEILGTFGISSLIQTSNVCTLYTETLPEDLIKMIHDWALRRRNVGF